MAPSHALGASSAAGAGTSAAASPHPNQVAFEEGTLLAMSAWTALRAAVENEWGGVDSAEKFTWFVGVVGEEFTRRGSQLDIEEVEDILEQIMLDEFHAVLEDDSAYLVAKMLVQLYKECVQGRRDVLVMLRQQVPQRVRAEAVCTRAPDCGEEDDDDEGDDEAGDAQKEVETVYRATAMDVDSSGNDMRPAPEQPARQMVDEDGFELVTKRGRRGAGGRR